MSPLRKWTPQYLNAFYQAPRPKGSHLKTTEQGINPPAQKTLGTHIQTAAGDIIASSDDPKLRAFTCSLPWVPAAIS